MKRLETTSKKAKIICEGCGNDFEIYRSRVGKRKYCSRECSDKYGDHSHGFKKGNDLYKKKKIKNGWKLTEDTREKIRLSRLGKSSGHKGHNHTEETKRKIREKKIGSIPWHKGKKLSDKHRENLSISHTGKYGERSSNWQGGKTNESKKIRGRIEYRLWRESVFARDNWTCQECGERGGLLNAHHIKSFANFPELRTSIHNGLTLCNPCHKKTDNYGRNKHESFDTSRQTEADSEEPSQV